MPIGSVFLQAAAPILGGIIGQAVGGTTAAQGQQQGSQQQVAGLQQGAQALQTGYQNAGPYLTNAYNTASGSYSPYTATGTAATTALGDLINNGYATNQFNNQDLNAQLAPNYAFQLGQGQQTTNAANNSLGGMLGGNALQGLQQYTQNYAGNAYQQAFTNYQTQRNNILSNLGTIAGQGLTATNNLAGITTGYGGSMANLNTSLGSALAGNYGQQGTALGAGTAGAANTMGSTYAGTGSQLGQLAGNYFGQPNAAQQQLTAGGYGSNALNNIPASAIQGSSNFIGPVA
jgi:hypothetical protein